MTLKNIAVKNLIRRKAKALFILAGLLIGVSTVVVVISFSEGITEDINHKLDKYGANILIVPKTENLALNYGGLSIGGVSFEMQEIHENDLEKIKTIKNAANVAAVGPLVLGAINIENRKVLLAGVDFSQTKLLKPWWNLKGKLPDENELIIGHVAAAALKKTAGDLININGRPMKIAGILNQTGSQDDQIIFTNLKAAQSILDKHGKISMAEVAALCAACPISEMVKQISEALPGAKVMAIQQVVKSRMEMLNQLKKFSYAVSIVVLLIGGLVVLVTMMSSVRERTDEIGIFRAIGYRKNHIMKIILLEATILSGLAGLAGYFLGIGITKIVIRFFSESSAAAVSVDLVIALGALFLSLLIGITSSIYPARIAANLEPSEALRAL